MHDLQAKSDKVQNMTNGALPQLRYLSVATPTLRKICFVQNRCCINVLIVIKLVKSEYKIVYRN